MPEKYRKKPAVIEALQWDGSARNAGPIIDWVLDGNGSASYYETNETPDRTAPAIRIQTIEGPIMASPGNWIIRGVQGEFYPCRADIFEQTYELVTEDRAPELSPDELLTVTEFGIHDGDHD